MSHTIHQFGNRIGKYISVDFCRSIGNFHPQINNFSKFGCKTFLYGITILDFLKCFNEAERVTDLCECAKKLVKCFSEEVIG